LKNVKVVYDSYLDGDKFPQACLLQELFSSSEITHVHGTRRGGSTSLSYGYFIIMLLVLLLLSIFIIITIYFIYFLAFGDSLKEGKLIFICYFQSYMH